MRQRDSYVYAAATSDAVKVGITRSLYWRGYALRRFEGRSFKIERTWEHEAPAMIEAMVCEVMDRESAVVAGREVFSVDLQELEREIELAISWYAEWGLSTTDSTTLRDVRWRRVDENLRKGRNAYHHPFRSVTPEVRATVERVVANGGSVNQAASAAGIAVSTVRKWWRAADLEKLRTGKKPKSR